MTKLQAIIKQCLKRGKLDFYPHLYNGEWHVAIRCGSLVYWLYPYRTRQDCINECRILNRRYNGGE